MSTEHDGGPSLHNYLGIIRRRKRYVLTIAPLSVALAVYIAFAVPPLYRSTATILLEQSAVNKDVVASTVVASSKQQIEIVEGRVLTPEMLGNLVAHYDPYPGQPLSATAKAQRILSNTTVERVDPESFKPEEESNAFSLSYDNPSPERAAAVAMQLAQLFLTYNQRARTEAATQATQFLASQAADLSRRLREADEQLRVFKSKHPESLPEDSRRNETEIDLDQRQLDSLEQEILRVEEKESLLSVQLSQMSPNMITQTGDLTDVATVRAKLAEAEQRYTSDHPEVIRLRAALKLLTEQTRRPTNGIVAGANNPQYQSTASELTSTRHELSALRAQAAGLRSKIDHYEALLRLAPAVEREYSEIGRRRSSLEASYQQIQDKLNNAQLARRFEVNDQGEHFTLLRAAFPSKSPVYPNRIGLILLGLLLGGVLSAIAVALAESADLTVRSVSDFPAIADAPLLGSIPRILNSRDAARRRLALASWVLAYSIVLVAIGAKAIRAIHG